MKRLHACMVVMGLLLPGLASCASPAGRYQQAVVQSQRGVACFGLPHTRDGAGQPPTIAGVSVMEVGSGGAPIWERDFVRDGDAESTLPAGQCLRYGDGGSAPAPTLEPGKRYQVELWGSAVAAHGPPQSRWFNGYFCVVDAAGALHVTAVVPGKQGALDWAVCSAPPRAPGRSGR